MIHWEIPLDLQKPLEDFSSGINILVVVNSSSIFEDPMKIFHWYPVILYTILVDITIPTATNLMDFHKEGCQNNEFDSLGLVNN